MSNREYKKLALFVLVSSGLGASAAFAATQGSLDSTSTGSSDIDAINDSVKITDVDDVAFPDYGGSDTGAVNQGDAFCVYRNGGDGYSITASNPSGSEFALVGATDGDVLQYTVALSESDDASSASAISYNTAVNFTSGSVFVDCSDEADGTNTAFDIRFAEQELRDSSSQDYTGTLQLLLSPIQLSGRVSKMLGMKTPGWSLLLVGFALLSWSGPIKLSKWQQPFDMALPSNIDFGIWDNSRTIATETTFCQPLPIRGRIIPGRRTRLSLPDQCRRFQWRC